MADLAVAAGYCDQQHLAHEVRAIAGTTAGALFAVAASDPYKDGGGINGRRLRSVARHELTRPGLTEHAG
jgi:hypothetical protein